MRWTVKLSKAKPSDDGSPRIDLAVPAFGYKNHIGIDRRHGLIRTWTATNAARHDGAQLANLVSKAHMGISESKVLALWCHGRTSSGSSRSKV